MLAVGAASIATWGNIDHGRKMTLALRGVIENLFDGAAFGPDSTAEFYDRAVKRNRSGRYSEALADFRKALSHRHSQKTEVWIRHNMGHSYEGLGDLEQALESFETAILDDPGEPAHHSCRGKCLYAKGRGTEALHELRAASNLQENPAERAATLFLLSRTAFQLERRGEAEKAIREALALVPSNQEYLSWQAHLSPR